MAAQTSANSIADALFAEPELKSYAVLDGASIDDLIPTLRREKPEHVCLYRGELAPDLAMCAPYLVRLAPGSAFAEWVIEFGWGKHWGIFALAPATVPFRDVRKHFRTFLIVKNTEGKSVYFRYYDPRVLRAFLPSCNATELISLFGLLSAYLVEDARDRSLIQFTRKDSRLCEEVVWRAEPAVQEASV